jgi:hypothetical protein
MANFSMKGTFGAAVRGLVIQAAAAAQNAADFILNCGECERLQPEAA